MENQPSASEPIQVGSVLAIIIDQLAGLAWQKIGLQPDPVTGGPAKDLAQARQAIDAVTALAAILEPGLDEADRRQLKNLTTDLRINYVQNGGGQS